jgi:hypothetical protein
MPRLTNRDYLIIRHFLARLWDENDGAAFANLPGYAQRELHDYFAPTADLTDAEAIAHRVAMTKAFPALPQSAGRIFAALRASLEGRPNQIVDRYREATTTPYTVAGKSRTIRVSAVSRPKVDVHYLTMALLQLARDDVDGKLLKKALKSQKRNERRRH